MKGREKDRINKKGGEKRKKIMLTVFPILIPQRFVKQLFKIDLGEDVKSIRNRAARMRICGKS